MIDNTKLAASFAHNDKSNVLSNILISDGVVTAQNDMTGISLDTDISENFCCNAIQLVKSLSNCDLLKIEITLKNNKVFIKSGRFKSNIETIDINSYPKTEYKGNAINVQHDILNCMNGISQFTDPNDVRLSLRGVELSRDSVNATNGHVAVKKLIEPISGFKSIIIPSKSINMMAKVNAHIDSVTHSGSIVFFNFNDGCLFSKVIDQKMPDINKILSDINVKTELSLIADAVKSINSMCDVDKTILIGKEIKTRSGNAEIDGFDINECAFNSDYLLKIIEIADDIDLSVYPKACPFEGDGIRGAVIGVII